MAARSILIYRLGSLGDTILALPSFRLIRAAHPDAAITVLTNAPVSAKAAPLASVLAGTGLADAFISYPAGLRNPAQLAALAAQLRDGKFDLAVSLTASRGLAASVRDYFFLRSTRIPRVVGVPFRRRDRVCLRGPDGLYESEAVRLMRRVEAFGRADLREPRWYDLALNPEEISAADRLLADVSIAPPFLAASVGTKTPLNDWGETNWRQLLEETSRAHPGLGLVLLGSADEATRSESLLRAWHGPSANLCGQASPRVSAAILARAALFIGHDSGPMHLAAAAGARCVVIYSARCPPGQWFPLGPGHTNLYPFAFFDPSRTTDLAHQQAALASIPVARVRDAVSAALRAP
jgi:ADP-heptose:LPS heptosyltransferase